MRTSRGVHFFITVCFKTFGSRATEQKHNHLLMRYFSLPLHFAMPHLRILVHLHRAPKHLINAPRFLLSENLYVYMNGTSNVAADHDIKIL